MGLEIERKFLVKGDFQPTIRERINIHQGYVSTIPECMVRIRMIVGPNHSGRFLTIKGESNESGLSRFEWEKEISQKDYDELIKECGSKKIRKTRYIVPVGKHKYEVDIFGGDNKGLVIAEIELKTEDEVFIKPEWLGEEVTGDNKYYNSSLIENPYKNW